MRRKITIAALLILILGAGFTTIRNKDLEIVKNLDIYCTLFRELDMFYVDETSPEKLVTTSINSMLASLDPYTTYIPEQEMDDFNFQTTGEYGGIGSLIRTQGDQIIIADPYEGFPAANSDLRAGDILLEVDGKSTSHMEISDVSDLLKGDPGTTLTVKIQRPHCDKILEKVLTREKITINNVSYSAILDEHTGYIRLSNFTTNASSEVKSAFLKLKEEDPFDRLIIDLRSNPGGLMIEAVRVCNLFIEKGQPIVSTRGKVERWDNDYSTTAEPLDTEIPLVILVNRSSASASEIVAGALQDLDRAVVIGQRTFGKGLVQTTRPLKYNAQLKVTTAKYYIPSGRCIQALDYSNRNEDGSVGVIPDSLVSEYQTKNGRIVYDGGGIEPDIEIVPEKISEIAIRLYTESVYFDYATLYRSQHDSIGKASSFNLKDREYEDFKSYVQEQNFEYETASSKAFNKLVETAKKEKYYALAEAEFSSLKSKLSHDNMKDLEIFREEIQQILEEEIIGRYYYHAGRIEQQITQDIQLKKALSVISNPLQVNRILHGEAGALTKK
ncbi:MAG: S41 family peptidase [Bacteroidales bacterium]|nr:S41 family peptidase [Bacteroidales bacterium]